MIKNHPNGNHHCTLPKAQTGAALLALMLVLIIGSSYFLVTKLNTNLALTQQYEETGIALSAAKNALIGYAVSYPDRVNPGDGPGYLPCPDIDNDGDAEGSCALAGPINWTRGRFPFETLELSEMRDSSGARLWYTLSENFRYGANKTVPLNSESPSSAELSINGVGDIVAVIFAPGEPFDNQDRDADVNDVTNYLEDDNSDADTSFVTNANVNFNDRLIVITRQELMAAVEKRVMGEVAQVLIDYFEYIDANDGIPGDNNAAYPWMTPFTDPKVTHNNLITVGRHDGGNNSASLIDNSQNFITAGVVVGDVVHNLTDSSIGIVTNVTATTLSIFGLSQGDENDFDGVANAGTDDDDQYSVFANPNVNTLFANGLTGSASIGSVNLTLEDNTKDFGDLNISAGDILNNISDVNSCMIETVSDDELTVEELNASVCNTYSNNDNYDITSNTGLADADSVDLTLEDDSKNFIMMGVVAGDLVVNSTDGSFGHIATVNADSLVIDALYFGVENDFDGGDAYVLPRYNTDNDAREGLLSFHEPGEAFSTAFSIDWNITEANGATVVLNLPGVYPTSYDLALQNYAESSAGTSGTINIVATDSVCHWFNEDVIECRGFFIDDFFASNVTAGVNSATLTDANVDFVTAGIKRGDIVQNFDDEEVSIVTATADVGSGTNLLFDAGTDFNAIGILAYQYLAVNNPTGIRAVVSEVVDNNTLRFEPYGGGVDIVFNVNDNFTIWSPQKVVVTAVIDLNNLQTATLSGNAPAFDVALNEYYRIQAATDQVLGVVDPGSPSATVLTDATADFINDGVEVDDLIENDTDNSFGIIANVTATQLTVAGLFGGTNNLFTPNDDYIIYHGYADTRQYEFHPMFSGTSNVYVANNQRERDLCLGYDAACNNLTANEVIADNPISAATPIVTITDFDQNDNEVASATVTLTGGADTGSIRLTGIDYYLTQGNDEIPDWLVKNGWHRLLYVALSDGDSPATAAACTAGVDCLTLTGSGGDDDDKRAVIIIAGDNINTTLDGTCNNIAEFTQDRSTGGINAYYEGQTCTQSDNNYGVGINVPQDGLTITDTFNDQIRILVPE